jgi:Ran GTPase-activating protein (RanGAP) involved in mRNA processing and transport
MQMPVFCLQNVNHTVIVTTNNIMMSDVNTFCYCAYDTADLAWLSRAITALRQNEWKAEQPLCFNGIAWSATDNFVREGATLSLLNALKVNKTARTLVLRNVDLDLKASKALSDVFAQNFHLDSISLKQLQYDSQPMVIPPTIFWNLSLQEVSLDACSLEEESCAALGKLLRASHQMRSLTLQNVRLGSYSWINALKQCRSLSSLTLKAIPLSGKSMHKLLAALTVNTSLTVLSMEEMQLSGMQADALALLLAKNKHLQKLSLRKNNLNGLGSAMQWIMSLKENKTLKNLDLSHNPLGDDGAKVVVAALQHNATLTTLCLISCEILQPGCECIAQGIASFPGMRHLSVDGNSMEQCGEQLEASLACDNIFLCHVLCGLPRLLAQEDASADVWKRIDFYLRLNKANRQLLCVADRVPDLFLPHLLKGAVAAEPDVLFHFICIILPAFASNNMTLDE